MVPLRRLTLLALALAGCGSDLSITPTTLPNAAEGQPYDVVLASSGNKPIHWKLLLGELPSGILLDPTAGTLTGTPQSPGQFTFTVESTESATFHSNDGKEPYTLTVIPKLVPESAVPEAEADQPYSHVVAVQGGVPPYTIQVRGLPAHFTFDAASQTISGSPSFAASYTIEIDVSDSGTPQQAAVTTPKLTIRPIKVAIATSAGLPGAQINAPYSTLLQVAHGAGPFQWSIVDGALPTGIHIDPGSGTISGTPTQAGTSLFTAQVADLGAPPDTATQQFSLTVQ